MSVFDKIEARMKFLAKEMNLSEDEVALLQTHKKISGAKLNVNGKEYPAWRIIHNNSLGPGKGGIRFHPGVTEDEVKALSFWMSIKNSLAGLPYGGAKGGVQVNPKELTKEELEELSRQFIRAFHDVIGQDKDIPAPDVYTTPQIMGYMLDEFEKIKGRHEPGMITGKPLALGGLPLRADSTSKGGVIVLNEFLKQKEIDKREITVAIQGFGNAGLNVAKMLYEDEVKIIAVSDSKGGIIDKDGLDIRKVIETKLEEGSVTKYDATQISNSAILETEVDVLILAALENQITEKNAREIKAKYIVELANGPVTPEADKVLYKNGTIVIPDILANAGGVVVSYFEWLQNKIGNILESDFLERKLNEIMKNAFSSVYVEFEANEHLDMRNAAYKLAIARILRAERARGNL